MWLVSSCGLGMIRHEHVYSLTHACSTCRSLREDVLRTSGCLRSQPTDWIAQPPAWQLPVSWDAFLPEIMLSSVQLTAESHNSARHCRRMGLHGHAAANCSGCLDGCRERDEGSWSIHRTAHLQRKLQAHDGTRAWHGSLCSCPT